MFFIINDDSCITSLSYKLKHHNPDTVYSKVDHNHNSYIGDIYVGNDGKLHKMTVGGADTVLPFNNKFDYSTLATSYNGDIFENSAGSINDGWADTSNSGIPHTFDTIVPLERNKKTHLWYK